MLYCSDDKKQFFDTAKECAAYEKQLKEEKIKAEKEEEIKRKEVEMLHEKLKAAHKKYMDVLEEYEDAYSEYDCANKAFICRFGSKKDRDLFDYLVDLFGI